MIYKISITEQGLSYIPLNNTLLEGTYSLIRVTYRKPNK